MNWNLIIFSALLALPFAAFAREEIKEGIDYTNCNPQGGMGFAPPYFIDKNGNFGFDKKSDRVVSWNANTNTLVVKDFWGISEGEGPKTQVKLVKGNVGGNNVPISLETTYDTAFYKEQMKKYGPMKTFSEFPSKYFTRFGVEKNKCFVKEISTVIKNKEMVMYDRALCEKVLGLAKQATMKKLMECKATFSSISALITDYQEKSNKQGRGFMMGLYGTPIEMHAKKAPMGIPFDQDWSAMMAAGSCNMMRGIYGESVDQDTAFGFGILGGMYGGGGGFSATESNQPAK